MIIALGRSRKDTKWRNTEMTWEQMLDRLRVPTRTRETAREYRAMSKEDKTLAKDVGGFVGGRIDGGRRLQENVKYRTLVTLDADRAPRGMWDNYAVLWDYTCAVYSTHSHTAEEPRLRWVFPLSRAVTPEEYEPVARKLAEIVGLDAMDPSTYEIHRLMYWPSVCSDGEYEFHELDGVLVEPDALLREYDPADPDGWKDSSRWPIGRQEREVVAHEATHQGDPETKPGMVGLFCRTYDVPMAMETFLPGVYEEAGEGRYTFVGGSTSGGAVLYNNGAFLYSHHATDPCSMQLVNAFDLVRIHRFGALDESQTTQEVTRRKSYQAMLELAANDPGVREQQGRERQAEADAAFADLVSDPEDMDADKAEESENSAENTPEKGEVPAWVKQLTLTPKTGLPEITVENVVLILSNAWGEGALAVNELKGRPVIRRPLPWHRRVADRRNGDQWTDADNANLRLYMEKYWGIVGKDKVQDGLDIVAERGRFNPVQEYLSGLVWDGTERLDTMLVRWLGAEDTEYTRAVTRKWMCAAVKRAKQPGCKFDEMLVLAGPQGIGKSRLASILSRGWFTDSLGRMDSSKDAYERLAGAWIAEVAELAAAKRSEVEDIKNFISKQEDTFRRAYQRETATYPRACVFYGTTNNAEFLRDRTGARRFWPVQCEGTGDHGVLHGLEAEVDQLWAEAVVRLAAGEDLWLTEASEQEAAAEQWDRFAVQDDEDELFGVVQAYLDMPIPINWEDMSQSDRRNWVRGETLVDRDQVKTEARKEVCIREIKAELLGEDVGGHTDSSYKLARIMNSMPGWVKAGKTKRTRFYGVQKVYVRNTDVDEV